jgi:hypothetical protein
VLSGSVQLIKLIPKSFRVPGLVMLPMLVVLLTMFYWLWRVRFRRSLRGLVVVTALEPALRSS